MEKYARKILFSFSCGIAFTELVFTIYQFSQKTLRSRLFFLFIIPFLLTAVYRCVRITPPFIIGVLLWLFNIICFIVFWWPPENRDFIYLEKFTILAFGYFLMSFIFAICFYKLKRNFFFGIGIYETYLFSEVWKKTHRFASVVITAFLPGQFLLIFFLKGWIKFTLCFAFLMLPLIVSAIYAKIIAKRYRKKEEHDLREQIKREEYPRY